MPLYRVDVRLQQNEILYVDADDERDAMAAANDWLEDYQRPERDIKVAEAIAPPDDQYELNAVVLDEEIEPTTVAEWFEQHAPEPPSAAKEMQRAAAQGQTRELFDTKQEP